MDKYNFLINNLDQKINIYDKKNILFKNYFLFIKENLNEFDDFYNFFVINYSNIHLKNYEWMIKVKLKLNLDEELFNFLICCIIFKNLLKKNNSFDVQEDNLNPFFINSSLLISNIKNNILGFIIYYKINCNNPSINDITNEIKLYVFKILNYLSSLNKSILISKKIKIIKNNKIKTPIFYGLIKEIWWIDYVDYANINLYKPNIEVFKNHTYIVGDGFWNCDSIFKYSKKTNSSFLIKEKSVLEKLVYQKCYIDKENLEYSINLIENELKINWQSIGSKLKNLYKIIKENEYNKKEIQKEASRLLIYFNVVVLKKLNIDENQPIYFKVEIDFRGRSYYNSPIGITYSKLNRHLFNFGFIKKEKIKINKSSFINERINTNLSILENICSYFNLEKNEINLHLIYWTLISIGKNFINKNEKKIEDTVFLTKAENFIKNNDKLELDIETKIELFSYTKIIKNLNNSFIKNTLIYKDATASVIQNYMRILGPKNNDSLEIANINSKYTWNDPYSIIIDYFLSKKKINNNIIFKIFNRKNLKKTIMTIPYEATYITCFDYFLEELKKNNKEIDILDFYNKKEFRKDITEYILNIFKDFYNFLKNDLEMDLLYKKETNSILLLSMNMIENNKNIKNDLKLIFSIDKYEEKEQKRLLLHDSSKKSYTNLIYYKLKNKYIDIIIKHKLNKNLNKRFTKEELICDPNEIDIKKIMLSIKPNYLHFHDAEFLRMIMHKMMNNNLKFIHDCVVVSIVDVEKLIITCNSIINNGVIKEYAKKNDIKLFSIFILL